MSAVADAPASGVRTMISGDLGITFITVGFRDEPAFSSFYVVYSVSTAVWDAVDA